MVFDGALGLSLVVRVGASHCGGFFGRSAQALGAQSSVIAARGLSSSCLTGCRVWVGSAVVACRLSCCGIFLDQGLNLCPVHCNVDS